MKFTKDIIWHFSEEFQTLARKGNKNRKIAEWAKKINGSYTNERSSYPEMHDDVYCSGSNKKELLVCIHLLAIWILKETTLWLF